MESNREEAERCIQIAKSAMEAGDVARARKFLLIAQRLKPDAAVEEELAKLGTSAAAESSSNPSTSKQQNGEFEGSSNSSSRSSDRTEATAEQIQIVKRINRTVDYYEILGLTKECNEEEVRKAYRKLSLKVHPDKNKAPGAEDAFKAVSKAFQCLNSVDLRERYDRYGPESALQQQQNQGMRQRRHRHQNDFFDDAFDPDEIFQAFFFGGRPGGFRRHHFGRTPPGAAAAAAAAAAQAPQQQQNFGGLLHLLLIVIVIVLTSFPMSQPSHYSLQRQSPYVHEMATRDRGVPYYVRSSSFDQEHPLGTKVRHQVEAQVERDYRDVLVQHCRTELNLRAWGQIRETPYCKMLEEFQQQERVY